MSVDRKCYSGKDEASVVIGVILPGAVSSCVSANTPVRGENSRVMTIGDVAGCSMNVVR
jgi:hypothetical protein